jgi:hypothetical protein
MTTRRVLGVRALVAAALPALALASCAGDKATALDLELTLTGAGSIAAQQARPVAAASRAPQAAAARALAVAGAGGRSGAGGTQFMLIDTDSRTVSTDISPTTPNEQTTSAQFPACP